jgi:hypothetical protein
MGNGGIGSRGLITPTDRRREHPLSAYLFTFHHGRHGLINTSETLREAGERGLTSTEWRMAAGTPEGTFQRLRARLEASGLVTRPRFKIEGRALHAHGRGPGGNCSQIAITMLSREKLLLPITLTPPYRGE